jgi:uncharacterized membrane protein YtjA (UPF0391 family)
MSSNAFPSVEDISNSGEPLVSRSDHAAKSCGRHFAAGTRRDDLRRRFLRPESLVALLQTASRGAQSMELFALARVYRNAKPRNGAFAMFGWALSFLIIALIAAVLGFGGIAGLSIEIAKIIFFVAVVLFAVSAVVGLVQGRSPTIP